MTTESLLFVNVKELTRKLAKVADFVDASTDLEQYITPAAIAAQVVMDAYYLGDVEGKSIVDFGAGTGMLSIAAAVCGASSVCAVEIDKGAYDLLRSNVDLHSLNDTINPVRRALAPIDSDTVIMNPPFGTQAFGSDARFLTTAFDSASVVYSFHLKDSLAFVKSFAADAGFELTNAWQYSFPLPATMTHHRKAKVVVPIVVVRLAK